MSEYHVGCGIAGIYAGTLNKKKDMWLHKSDVTEEAIKAVIGHMYYEIPKGENSFAYAVRLKDGKYARLKIEVSDECPEWSGTDTNSYTHPLPYQRTLRKCRWRRKR